MKPHWRVPAASDHSWTAGWLDAEGGAHQSVHVVPPVPDMYFPIIHSSHCVEPEELAILPSGHSVQDSENRFVDMRLVSVEDVSGWTIDRQIYSASNRGGCMRS